ncbi:MAG: DNA primase/helicase, phage-associated [Candidatus Kapaibacterium sp.]|nr:MAG: DNA primase/helicase, phage-associated [Candidatus Kapabacteria bacterium]
MTGIPKTAEAFLESVYFPTTSPSFELDEVGVAKRFAYLLSEKVKFDFDRGFWCIFDEISNCWNVDKTNQVMLLLDHVIEDIKNDVALKEKYTTREINSFIKRCNSYNYRAAVLNLSKSLPSIKTVLSDWDSFPGAVVFRNGILKLPLSVDGTLDFKLKTSKDLVLNSLNADYDAKAKCPRWIETLNSYFDGNQELIRFVQQLLGVTLTGVHFEESFVFLHGNGANGKSTFINVLQQIFGSYSLSVSIEEFLSSYDNRPRLGLAQAVGKRLVVSNEIPSGRSLDESLMKHITGGEQITVRHLFKPPFSYKPTFKIWLIGNEKPIIRSFNAGIWRRVILIPFETQIPPEKREPQFRVVDNLLKEASGIVNWIIEGYFDFIGNGFQFKTPKIVSQAVESYRCESDFLSDFCQVHIKSKPGSNVFGKDLYEKFKIFCLNNNEPVISIRKFFKALSDRGYKATTDRQRFKIFQDIELQENVSD